MRLTQSGIKNRTIKPRNMFRRGRKYLLLACTGVTEIV